MKYTFSYILLINFLSNQESLDVDFSLCFENNHSESFEPSVYALREIPLKFNIKYKDSGNAFTLSCWLLPEMANIFRRFYGAHPETRADFMIRIDADNNKYELSLYRQGLKEPVVIPESAYQLIGFKNKFEFYRSANYDQPRGAWIW